MKKDEYGCLYRLRKRILSLTKAIVKYNDRNDMITYLSDILKWLKYGEGPNNLCAFYIKQNLLTNRDQFILYVL